MKITTLLMTISLVNISASVQSQNFSMSLQTQGKLVREAFDMIEDQTDYRFFFNDEFTDLNKKISVDIQGRNIDEIMQLVLADTKITYRVMDNGVILVTPISTSTNVNQQVTITGRVTDENGNPLLGVNIQIEGTLQGVITDENGKYTLTVPNQNVTLLFSYIGYLSEKVAIEGRSVIDVVLVADIVNLEEVVVVGYGTNKKINVTGSITSLNSKEITSVSSSNLTDNLTGKLPGLRVLQRTSEPGDYNSNYNIRGWGSPLIIIDGVQRDDFVKIDPSEIESVTILKDASAAIYGVKAANGVILLNTYKGKVGKPEITLNSRYGWQNITSFPKPMNVVQWIEVINEANMNAGSSLLYSESDLENYKNGTLEGTDWYSLVIQNNAPQEQHNLSISGGSEKIKYFSSIGYLNQEGIWKSGDLNYKRYNIRANVTAQINNNLDAELGLGSVIDNKNAPETDTWEIFKSIWMQKPVLPVYANNNQDYMGNVADGTHPLAVTNSDISGYCDTQNKNFQGNFALNYTIPFITGLKSRFFYSYDIYYNHSKEFSKEYMLYEYDAATDEYTSYANNSPSSLSESNSELDRSTLQLSLTYEKSIQEKHNVKGLILFENLTTKSDNFYGSTEFSVDAVDELYAGNSENQQISSDKNNVYELANQGIIGRLNYDYDSKYLMEFSFRYDGSSKFIENKRWGFFPAVSLGWRISEERFIKDRAPYLTNLKLRASWGQLGDDDASSFQFLSGYTYPSGSYYLFDNAATSGLGFKGMANENITWYKATTMNLGIEGSLWNNKLNFQVDVFRRERDGLLDTRELSLPQTVGASLPEENLNSDLSKGYELVLGHANRIGQISYSITGNFSYARNKMDYVEEAQQGNSYLNWKNSSSDRWDNVVWGYKCIGQFQSFEEIYNSPIEDGDGNRKLLPGDLKYEDYNKDGIINSDDQRPIFRENTPEINYGVTLTCAWKGFDFSALLQGATNFNLFLREQFLAPIPWGRNGLSQYYDRWHRADLFDENSEWVSGKYPSTRVNGSAPWNTYNSTFNVIDGTYLRLKNLEIGYSIPRKYVDRIGIQKLRVYANGYNLITWSDVAYVDPEHTMDSYGYLYPIMRNFNIGLNVTF